MAAAFARAQRRGRGTWRGDDVTRGMATVNGMDLSPTSIALDRVFVNPPVMLQWMVIETPRT